MKMSIKSPWLNNNANRSLLKRAVFLFITPEISGYEGKEEKRALQISGIGKLSGGK
jgi:hypothetical protein